MSDSPAGAQPRPGLLCAVLRPAEGGSEARPNITATALRVVLTAPEGEVLPNPDRADAPLGSAAPVTDPSDPGYAPELQLRERRGFLIACPPDAGPKGDPYAFGGNWLWSDDGRFPEPWPIPVHDRDLRLEAVDPAAPKSPPRGLKLESRELRDSAVGAQLAGEDMLAGGYLVRIYPVEGGEDEFRWYAEAFGYSGRCLP